jgi:hypothetical protein
MCLACSTPVRGRAFGSECLASVRGSDAPASVESGRVRPARPTRVVTLVAFAAAVIATTLPWSRFGPGSGAFGAWTRAGRWSLVAAAAGVTGLVLAILSFARPEPSRPRELACAILGGAVAIAAALSVLFPPAFSRPWLGPWVAFLSGMLACGATVVGLRSAENDAADI